MAAVFFIRVQIKWGNEETLRDADQQCFDTVSNFIPKSRKNYCIHSGLSCLHNTHLFTISILSADNLENT